MAALQTFDQALSDSAAADRDAWSDDGVVLVGELAAKLSDEELALLRTIWPDRPLLWQSTAPRSWALESLSESTRNCSPSPRGAAS